MPRKAKIVKLRKHVQKYTNDRVSKILDLLQRGSSIEDACILTDISTPTYYAWLAKYPEFTSAINKAKSEFKQNNIDTIRRASRRHWQSSAWFLERKHPDEYALKTVTEHKTKDDEPINIILSVNNTPRTIQAVEAEVVPDKEIRPTNIDTSGTPNLQQAKQPNKSGSSDGSQSAQVRRKPVSEVSKPQKAK